MPYHSVQIPNREFSTAEKAELALHISREMRKLKLELTHTDFTNGFIFLVFSDLGTYAELTDIDTIVQEFFL